jgi:hypothetical protein
MKSLCTYGCIYSQRDNTPQPKEHVSYTIFLDNGKCFLPFGRCKEESTHLRCTSSKLMSLEVVLCRVIPQHGLVHFIIVGQDLDQQLVLVNNVLVQIL